MARYGYAIGAEDGVLSQFDHETGAFVRRVGQLNPAWTASVSDFDTVTGLPNPDVLGATDTSVPCSVAASPSLAYLYDTYTCRILALDPDTGAVFVQFGGRRGIGAGRIELDGLPRSVCAVANGKLFATDNAGGFVVRWSLFGDFEAEHAIAGWAAALSLSFDQVTGWTYEPGRQLYWALAQSSSAAYLFAVNTAGAATGEVIDLTARLATTLSITVGGHGNSPAERVRTRGLVYNNGRLFLFSQGRLIRVDLTNTDGDRLLVSAVNDLSPGNVRADGAELTYVLRDQPNNAAVVYVVDEDGAALRSYGESFSPANGEDGDVAEPWDATVSPTEESAARIARGIALRARITAVTARAIQMRAAIRAVVTRSQTMRARLLNLGPLGQQVSMRLRARIEEPSTFPDRLVESWELTDSLGQFSRSFSMTARGRAGFQVGDTFTLYAGYGTDRVKLFQGEIDEISRDLSTDVESWSFTVHDRGAQNAANKRFTKTWSTQHPRTTSDISSVSASNILSEIGSLSATPLQGVGFFSYPIYGNFATDNLTVLQAINRLAEPFAQFSSRLYAPRFRDGELRIVEVRWASPPSGGYRITRERIKQLARSQQRYIGSPDLRGQTLRVKGVNVSYALIDQIGPQVRIEYFRSIAQGDVNSPSAANTGQTTFAQQYVVTEHFSVEEVWGDKVTSRTAEVYADGVLIGREVEETLYFEPASDGSFASIQFASAGPSPLALPYQTNSTTSGIDPSDGVFKEQNRTQTNYYYDQRNQLASETTNVTTFDTATGHWVLDTAQFRPISETTGGSSRIRRYSFSNQDGVLAFDGVDSQQVGGGRPDPAQITGNATVVTFQAMAPEPQVVFDNNRALVVDPGEAAIWLYENGMLGQRECETVLSLAQTEQALQESGARWETVSFTGVLDPNLQAGMAVAIEVTPGVFIDYWLESANHSFSTGEALTRGVAKRITTDDLP